jgi:hypothetical protein
MANFSTPDKISDFYSYDANVDVYYKLDETSYHTFSDCNLRINAWNNNNTQVLTDYWIYSNTGGYVNLGTSLGLAIRSGWRFEVYAYSGGTATTSKLFVQRLAGTTTTIVDNCNWQETSVHTFTVYSGGYYQILAEGGSCLANVSLSQNVGQLYDGCSISIDTYGWMEGTAANGNAFSAFSSGDTLTTNGERGANNGTYITFGVDYGGYSTAKARTYIGANPNNVTVSSVIATGAYAPCTTMYTFIDVNGVRRTTGFYSQGNNVQVNFTFSPSAIDYTCNIGLEQY